IAVSHLCRFALSVLVMNGISAGWIADLRGTAQTAFYQVASKRGYASDGNDVILAFNFTRDRSVYGLKISRPILRRQHDRRNGFQRFALLGICPFIDVVRGKIPFP